MTDAEKITALAQDLYVRIVAADIQDANSCIVGICFDAATIFVRDTNKQLFGDGQND